MRSTTTSAARGASRRSPCSFQARTTARAGPAYTTAARAEAKASRRPAHSRHRSTGHAVGAPQRLHHGGESGRKRARHVAQSASAERRQATQRRGKRRSMSHADERTDEAATCQ